MAIWNRHTAQHYDRDDLGFISELPLKPILQFLVKEGVALDRDKAKKAVEDEIGEIEQEGMISFSEFNRIFVKGVFKQALIRIAATFDKAMAKKGEAFRRDMNLSQKIDIY